jgi:nitroreductase
METAMHPSLKAISQRRALRVFDISPALRDELLHAARFALASFTAQPYHLFWAESPASRRAVARLCFGQPPAQTASALLIAVAELDCWRSTSLAQLAWMRAFGFSPEKISEYERKSKFSKWFYFQGWCNRGAPTVELGDGNEKGGLFGAFKWIVFRALNLFEIIGTPLVTRQGLFKWATESTSLACENLMIAAESLGLNTCPMEDCDFRRLSRFLRLTSHSQEIVMVIAVGKKSPLHMDQPQWRGPLESTVTIL